MRFFLQVFACVITSLLFLSPAMAADAEKAAAPGAFKDSFDGKLGDGWTWLREQKGKWRVKDGGLEIQVQPGVANTVKNALLRPAPDRSKKTWVYEVTVSNHSPPKVQYEQVGMTWYSDGRPVFKVVKELINGKLFVIPGKLPVEDKPVRLRVVADAEGLTAMYQVPGEKEFKKLGVKKIAPGKNEQISLQCYNGPPEDVHWMRFEDFEMKEEE